MADPRQFLFFSLSTSNTFQTVFAIDSYAIYYRISKSKHSHRYLGANNYDVWIKVAYNALDFNTDVNLGIRENAETQQTIWNAGAGLLLSQMATESQKQSSFTQLRNLQATAHYGA